MVFSKTMKLIYTYTFNRKFYKQIDGCTMEGPLSVTFSDIYDQNGK